MEWQRRVRLSLAVVLAIALTGLAAPAASGGIRASGVSRGPAKQAATNSVASTSGVSARATGVGTQIRGWSTKPRSAEPEAVVRDRIRVLTPGGNQKRKVVLKRKRSGKKAWRRVSTFKTKSNGRLIVRFPAPEEGAWKYRLKARPSGGAGVARTKSRRVNTGKRIFVVGDIGYCEGAPDQTAALIRGRRGKVVVPGDVAYPSGTDSDFANCYDPAYGSLRSRTFPVPGNHDYYSGGDGYFNYFGSRVGTKATPWYTVKIGAWQFYMLNSNCDAVGGCDAGSAQYAWLQSQIAADAASGVGMCTAAVWHHPVWSSGSHGNDDQTVPLLQLLTAHRTDLLLTGHEHSYERFTPLSANGTADVDGIREFVVGTGGAGLRGFNAPEPGSEARLSDSHGVLRMNLTSDGYNWQFLPTQSGVGTDSGAANCR